MSTCQLRRYLLYVGRTYYPGAAMDDFVDSFDVRQHAEDLGRWLAPPDDKSELSWYEVVDTHSTDDVRPMPYEWW